MPAFFIDATGRGRGRGGFYRPSNARRPYDGGYGTSTEGDEGEGDKVPLVEEGPVNRYAVVHERQSATTRQWELVEPPSDSGDGPSFTFTAKHRTYAHYAGHPSREPYTAIKLHAEPLIQILRASMFGVEEIYADQPSIDSKLFFSRLAPLREYVKAQRVNILEREAHGGDTEELNVEKKDGEGAEPQTLAELIEAVDQLETLLTWIKMHFAPTQRKLDRLLADGVISYALLWTLFNADDLVETTDEDHQALIAMKVESTSLQRDPDGVSTFYIMGTRLLWNGKKYLKVHMRAGITSFAGTKSLASLAARPLTEKHREELIARGKLYCGLTKVCYLEYSGTLTQVIGKGMAKQVIRMRAEGRAVVDVINYIRMNPARDPLKWFDAGNLEDQHAADIREHALYPELKDEPVQSPPVAVGTEVMTSVLEDEKLCLLGPTIFGFSLARREWGELRVDQFRPVSFNDKAYDQLVLDPDTKDLIRSLVEQNSRTTRQRENPMHAGETDAIDAVAETPPVLTDIISGKGGGLVIVLHGRPGVGKTLTAEAVSEFLHTPLYSVGAGELGVKASELESKLRDVLDISQAWGAVTLIDEADICLEERSLHDVTRNGMVSVFLRLLEYHSGILVLTTNRIRTIDPAFLSRFSLAITYPDLDATKRRTVWTSFLRLAGVGIDPPVVKKIKSNGNEVVKTDDWVPTSTISAEYLNKLAEKSAFNGRSIKNIVRTSQALALSKGVPLSQEHIEVVVKVTETFSIDIKEADEEGVYDAKGEGWRDRTGVYN